MFKKSSVFNAVFLVSILSLPVYAQDTGTMPVPVFTDAGVGVVVSYDAAEGLYSYSYTISNPAGNTGKIWTFDIDIRRPRNSMELSGAGLTIPHAIGAITFDEEVNEMPNPRPMVPVGLVSPPGLERSGLTGWGGSLSNGFVGFFGKPRILPGESQGGFKFISRGLPGIRDIEIEPKWVMSVDRFATDEDVNVAIAVEQQLKVSKKTIGPTAPPGSTSLDFLALHERIVAYIDESITLGWLTDTTLADNLRAKLTAARQFMDADDGTQAKVALGEFMTLLDNASTAQRSGEGYGLLYYNAKYIQDRLPDSVIPPVTLFDLSPVEGERTLGTTHTLTATVTTDSEPMYCWPVGLEVVSGPNAGLILPEGLPGLPGCTPPGWAPPNAGLLTDENGQSIFSYTSKLQGTDKLVAHVLGETGLPFITSEPVEVDWSGGPDLAIKLFSPPMIEAIGGAEITVMESTANMGNVTAGPSITRYYLSDDELIDPATDTFIGERQVESLEPGMESDGGERLFVLPSDLAEGIYYMWGCADADDSVTEVYEYNNCLKNQVVTQIAIPVMQLANQPPVCGQAFPSIASL